MFTYSAGNNTRRWGKRCAAALMLAALLALLAGCGGTDPETADPVPTNKASSSNPTRVPGPYRSVEQKLADGDVTVVQETFRLTDQLTYRLLSDHTAVLTRAEGYEKYEAKSIPWGFSADGENYTVTVIGEKAFLESKIRSITVPSCVCEISPGAFMSCTWLETFSCYGTEPVISGSMFIGCSGLKKLNLNQNMYTVTDDVVFSGDGTELIYFPAQKWTSGYTVPDTCTRINRSSCMNIRKHDQENIP